MKRLGIEHLANRSFADLSGGQQQRVLLGRALCSADDLLLLDEPVAGLDPVATAELYATIEQLNRDGMTVIMVSHDLLSSLKYATKILWLQNDGYEILTAQAFAEKLPTFLYGGLTK
jgi:zinc transport system ATP-binding protein